MTTSVSAKSVQTPAPPSFSEQLVDVLPGAAAGAGLANMARGSYWWGAAFMAPAGITVYGASKADQARGDGTKKALFEGSVQVGSAGLGYFSASMLLPSRMPWLLRLPLQLGAAFGATKVVDMLRQQTAMETSKASSATETVSENE